MNRQNNPQEVIVSGIHLDLTPSLKTFVQEKAERFTAKGHIQIYGPDMNASVSADECHKAVAMLIDKLDRMIERRAHMVKAKRQRIRVTDLEGAVPEAI